MPVIVGYAKSGQNDSGYIDKMASELLVRNYVSKVESYWDSNISISQVSLSFLGNKKLEYKDAVPYMARKKNDSHVISRILTLEIYLRHLHKRGYLKKMEKIIEGAI